MSSPFQSSGRVSDSLTGPSNGPVVFLSHAHGVDHRAAHRSDASLARPDGLGLEPLGERPGATPPADLVRGEVALRHTVGAVDLRLRPTPLGLGTLMVIGALSALALLWNEAIPIGVHGALAVLWGLVLMAAWRTWQVLRGLTMRLVLPASTFAGDNAMVELRVANPDRRARWDIGVRREGLDSPSSWMDLPPRAHDLTLVACPTRSRGLHPMPDLLLQTGPSLSLFQASARWRHGAQLLVVPRPLTSRSTSSEPVTRWAASGRPSPPDGRRLPPFWLDLADIDAEWLARPVEEVAATQAPIEFADEDWRLSRLVAAVLQAERQERRYGLRLGAVVVPPNRGLRHQRHCLALLAHIQLQQLSRSTSSNPRSRQGAGTDSPRISATSISPALKPISPRGVRTVDNGGSI